MVLNYMLKFCLVVAAWIKLAWCRTKDRFLSLKLENARTSVTPATQGKDPDAERIGSDGSLHNGALSTDANSTTVHEDLLRKPADSLETTSCLDNPHTPTTSNDAEASKNADAEAGPEQHCEENLLSLRRHAIDPETAFVELRKELESIRKEALPRNSTFFYPNDGLRGLIIPKKILAELKRTRTEDTNDELEKHSKAIHKDAPRLFAILVSINLSKYICDIMSEGVNDSDLPFDRCDAEGLVKLCSKKGLKEPIKCMTESDVHLFNRTQHSMLSPTFRIGQEIEHQELHDDCVLPFIEDHERRNVHKPSQGGYSSVSKVKIHPSHQIFDDQGESEVQYPFLALKCLHLPDEGYFRSEVAMLTKFGQRRNPHLIKLLATFRYKEHYYLLFPYAKSNLRQYWESNPTPEFSSSSAQWLLNQSKALASGLHTVHSSTDEAINSTPSSLQSHAGDITSRFKDDVKRYGRHGDIKPENILWFENGDIEGADDEEGALVITDFGLTDLHRRATISDISAITCTGTATYEPPELRLGGKISRAYDIWSLGCTFLEHLTWFVCGWQVLDKFSKARRTPTLPNFLEDTFYHIPEQGYGESQRAEICQRVTKWMMEMRELPRCSAFVDDFLDLISNRMLVADPLERTTATGLKTELRRMREKARDDPSYLTGPNASRQPQQFPSINDGFKVYSLLDGTLPVLNRTDGIPLPKRNGMAAASHRLRSVSPPVKQTFFCGM